MNMAQREIRTRKSLADSLVRLYDDKLFTDVTFKFGNQPGYPAVASGFEHPDLNLTTETPGEDMEEPPTAIVYIKAHKLVLAARSKVFETMFYHGGFQEAKDDIVSVTDLEPNVFESLLRYIYTDDVEDILQGDTVIPLLYASHKYLLDGLTECCLAYLSRHSTAENICSILANALFYGTKGQPSIKQICEDLVQKCLRLVRARANDVLQSEDFVELSKEALAIILPDDKLVVEGENVIYGACVAWAKKRCVQCRVEPSQENMRQQLGSLLKCIRFTVLLDQELKGELPIVDDVLDNIHLLSIEERRALKAYKQTGGADCQSFISSLSKKKRLTFCVMDRYERVCPKAQWECKGYPDSIGFFTDEDIYLLGIGIYGPEDPRKKFTVKVIVNDHDTDLAIKPIRREEVPKKAITSHGHSLQKPYKIYFQDPVFIKARIVYAIIVVIDGPLSFHGIGGRESCTCHGVTFSFKSKSLKQRSNRTCFSRGQIPQLLFRLP